MQNLKTRRFVLAASMLGAVVALMLVVLPAAAETGGNRLQLDIVATTPGPLTTCSEDGTGCGAAANTVRHYLYVRNANQVENLPGRTRADVPGAFVVSRIDTTTFVDGVETYNSFQTPPPDTNYSPYSGHWVATAACPPGAGPPCTEIGRPAVLPGERTAVFYTGWAHGDEEPNGLYVFRFTVHGTVNGEPVDLTASSPPIRMTD
jgi:hypothetical protein